MDPIKFLREEDPWIIAVQQAVAAASAHLQNERDQNRANLIGEAFGKVLKAALGG